MFFPCTVHGESFLDKIEGMRAEERCLPLTSYQSVYIPQDIISMSRQVSSYLMYKSRSYDCAITLSRAPATAAAAINREQFISRRPNNLKIISLNYLATDRFPPFRLEHEGRSIKQGKGKKFVNLAK